MRTNKMLGVKASMPKKKRGSKNSKAKQFSQVENIAIGGITSRLSPIGLWTYASSFATAAVKLPASKVPFDPVKYYLACHSIELALKAYLAIQGSTLIDLSEAAFGHKLDVILSEAKRKGLAKVAPIKPDQESEIRKASLYYSGKVFEYPAIGEALCAYPNLPNLNSLLTAGSSLVNSLEDPCKKA